MSNTKDTKARSLTRTHDELSTRSEISLTAVLAKLPNWALVPSVIFLFALLLTDLVLADPLPFIDEAALLWALVSGMRVLGARRRVARDAAESLPDGSVDAVDRPAPGQPLRVPNG